MSRRDEPSWFDVLLGLFKTAPSWVGPVVAALAFVLLRRVLPACFPAKNPITDVLRSVMPLFSIAMTLTIVVAWIAAELWKWQNRRLVGSQTGVGSIRGLSWREFERLVCEAYRRRGYAAELVGTANGDGGVDVRLNGHGEVVLVQCKQWRVFRVGVKPIRELLGVVVSERASRGIVVASGRFTQEARRFAQANRQIELVDGPQLAELVRGVQRVGNTRHVAAPLAVGRSAQPACPVCGAGMVLRTARKGSNAGSKFWGCASFPKCKGTRSQN